MLREHRDITFSYAPSDQIGSAVLDTQDTGRQFWDGWVTDTAVTVELSQQGMLEPLDS